MCVCAFLFTQEASDLFFFLPFCYESCQSDEKKKSAFLLFLYFLPLPLPCFLLLLLLLPPPHLIIAPHNMNYGRLHIKPQLFVYRSQCAHSPTRRTNPFRACVVFFLSFFFFSALQLSFVDVCAAITKEKLLTDLFFFFLSQYYYLLRVLLL